MHWIFGWEPLIQYVHLVFSFMEPEAPSKYLWFSFGFKLMDLGSFPLWFPLACTLFESDIKRDWFLEVWITPIWTSLSCFCIKDSKKAFREGIFQLEMEALSERNVEKRQSTLSQACSVLIEPVAHLSSLFRIAYTVVQVTWILWKNAR